MIVSNDVFFLLAQHYIATATMELLVLLTTLFLVAHCNHSRPNVVFMMADDFGYGDTEYNGGNASTSLAWPALPLVEGRVWSTDVDLFVLEITGSWLV